MKLVTNVPADLFSQSEFRFSNRFLDGMSTFELDSSRQDTSMLKQWFGLFNGRSIRSSSEIVIFARGFDVIILEEMGFISLDPIPGFSGYQLECIRRIDLLWKRDFLDGLSTVRQNKLDIGLESKSVEDGSPISNKIMEEHQMFDYLSQQKVKTDDITVSFQEWRKNGSDISLFVACHDDVDDFLVGLLIYGVLGRDTIMKRGVICFSAPSDQYGVEGFVLESVLSDLDGIMLIRLDNLVSETRMAEVLGISHSTESMWVLDLVDKMSKGDSKSSESQAWVLFRALGLYPVGGKKSRCQESFAEGIVSMFIRSDLLILLDGQAKNAMGSLSRGLDVLCSGRQRFRVSGAFIGLTLLGSLSRPGLSSGDRFFAVIDIKRVVLTITSKLGGKLVDVSTFALDFRSQGTLLSKQWFGLCNLNSIWCASEFIEEHQIFGNWSQQQVENSKDVDDAEDFAVDRISTSGSLGQDKIMNVCYDQRVVYLLEGQNSFVTTLESRSVMFDDSSEEAAIGFRFGIWPTAKWAGAVFRGNVEYDNTYINVHFMLVSTICSLRLYILKRYNLGLRFNSFGKYLEEVIRVQFGKIFELDGFSLLGIVFEDSAMFLVHLDNMQMGDWNNRVPNGLADCGCKSWDTVDRNWIREFRFGCCFGLKQNLVNKRLLPEIVISNSMLVSSKLQEGFKPRGINYVMCTGLVYEQYRGELPVVDLESCFVEGMGMALPQILNTGMV